MPGRVSMARAANMLLWLWMLKRPAWKSASREMSAAP